MNTDIPKHTKNLTVLMSKSMKTILKINIKSYKGFHKKENHSKAQKIRDIGVLFNQNNRIKMKIINL